MPSARDVILKHIDAVNGHDSDADPWAADAEMTAPGAQVSGRDNVIGFIAAFQEAFPDLRLNVEQLLTDDAAAHDASVPSGEEPDGVGGTPEGSETWARIAVLISAESERSFSAADRSSASRNATGAKKLA
jgi:hypothetical protein